VDSTCRFSGNPKALFIALTRKPYVIMSLMQPCSCCATTVHARRPSDALEGSLGSKGPRMEYLLRTEQWLRRKQGDASPLQLCREHFKTSETRGDGGPAS
jgi:hypothetical protein